MTQPNDLNKKKSLNRKGSMVAIGVIVVVAIVIIAALLLSNIGQNKINEYKATIYVHVTSAHIANTIDIDLYADGKSIKTGTLDALSSSIYQYDAWLSGSSDSIVISGTGHGGSLGNTSDSSTITVADGETYNVYLIL
jgi:hypothetical protein